MFSGCVNLEFLNITQFVFNRQENCDYMFDKDLNLHLYTSSQFYDRIIKMNEYLDIIDDNITIIDRIYDQIFTVTIEVFKYRKGHGEKEHEIPNLNEPVYFLGEDFKNNETDFKIYLEGKKQKFSKNFTFSEEGNYTMTFKAAKEFESLENLFRNCYYITKINITKINGNKLTDISKLFYNCDGLYELNLSGLDIKNVIKAN